MKKGPPLLLSNHIVLIWTLPGPWDHAPGKISDLVYHQLVMEKISCGGKMFTIGYCRSHICHFYPSFIAPAGECSAVFFIW